MEKELENAKKQIDDLKKVHHSGSEAIQKWRRKLAQVVRIVLHE